jgi:uncharacterized membrane protein YkvI
MILMVSIVIILLRTNDIQHIGPFVVQSLVLVLVFFCFLLALSFEGARTNSEDQHFL